MKTALDYYDRGKIKESNADDYNSNISYFKGRFVCPECGEAVYIRPSKYSNFFVHYKRTSENDECDRRVDGVNTESIYERTGLPLYLRSDNKSIFNLFLGFKALPENVMIRAEKENAFVSVDRDMIYKINRERFSFDGTVMLPVDYIPISNHNYNVTIKPANLSNLIEKYWSNYADGFSYEGALFTVTENGGRKIRHGDNVATDTEYYWVRRQNQLPSFYQGIEMVLVGKLSLRNSTWSVFKGSFSSAISDAAYRSLISFLRDNLRVHLLEKVPEIIPLWPPLIKENEGYKYNNGNKKIYGRIISGNDDPRVYLYRDVSNTPEILTINNGITEVFTRNSNIVINIDRKYISSGIAFLPENSIPIKEAKAISSEFKENILELEGLDSKRVFVFKNTGEIVEIENEERVSIDNLKTGDYVVVLGHQHVFLKILILLDKIVSKSEIDEKTLLLFLQRKYRNVSKVILPHKLKSSLASLKIKDKRLAIEIKATLDKNEIEYPLVEILERYLDDK